MKNNQTASEATSNDATYRVHGAVLDTYQQPMPGIIVSAYNKTMRGKTLLGTTVTAADGSYTIAYTLKNPKTAALIVGIFDAKGNPLKENDAIYDIPAELQADFDLSGRPLAGPADFDRLMELITPFTEDIPLANMTETAADPDLSFIVQKTGLDQTVVEHLAMAARFETFSKIPAWAWYALLRLTNNNPATPGTPSDFEHRVNQALDALMHSTVDALTAALQAAINANTIAYHYLADVPEIGKQLGAQIVAYAQSHPVTGEPSVAMQQALISGLSGDAASAFVQARNSGSSGDDLWEKIRQTPALSNNSTVNSLQTVMQVSVLAGNNMAVTHHLVNSQGLSNVSDIKKLAGTTKDEFAAMLTQGNVTFDDTVPGNTNNDKIQHVATKLDAAFSAAFPTATFAARLQKDTQNNLPHADKVAQFLQSNENFDLLHNHVGTFIKNNKQTINDADAAKVTTQVRRMQRVFRLTRSYEGTTALLNDNIHSARQITKMGKDNFVNKYTPALGQAQAANAFEKAATVNANAVALTNNLRSMADASAMNAFPDFGAAITQGLSNDLPDLDTLFGKANYCDCDECSSVYGAPAYLTDILHFLSKRIAKIQIPPVAGAPTVKDYILSRRPDIADIDLNCNNTNTQIPYIDIACELMEDYIAPPVTNVAASQAAQFVKGVINAQLLATIKSQFNTAGFTNVNTQLTSAAVVTDSYTSKELQADGTFLSVQHWLIRDTQIILKASKKTDGTVDVRMMHQTLQSSDTINAEPEYVNVNAYNKIISAVNSFSLPFDLFETEGEFYLQQLGISKADLNNIFRKEDHTAPGNSISDNRIGYTSLNINSAEQKLIFQADVANQANYWGTLASGTTGEVDKLEQKTGLAYADIQKLISLKFINPAQDTVIEHDGIVNGIILNDGTSTQNLTNLTPAKFDSMHRFIRLWRKTTFTMDELDAIIMAPSICAGLLTLGNKAYLIHQFTVLQQRLKLGVFPLLAFYQNIDTTHSLPNCLYNQLFQNPAITNPVNAAYAIGLTTNGNTVIADADKPILAAILQLSVADLTALLPKTTSKISLANFSILYRHTLLAQALNLSITDLLNLLNLIDVNPFTSVITTTQFLDKYKLLQSSGFSIDELNYLLRHQNNTSNTLIPSAGQVTNALAQVQAEFLAIEAATQPADDPNGVLFKKWLSDGVLNFDSGILNKVVDILTTLDDATYLQKLTDNDNFLKNLRFAYHDAFLVADLAALPLDGSGNEIVIPASISTQLTFDSDKNQLRFVGYMNATDKSTLLALVNAASTNTNDIAFSNAINYFYSTTQQTASDLFNLVYTPTIASDLKLLLGGNTAGRFNLLLGKLSGKYVQLQQTNTLIKDISNWFTLDKSVCAQLLASIPGIFTDFSDSNFVSKTIPLPNSVAQINRYQSVAKISFVASRLKLTATDLAYMLAHAAEVSILNLATLPLAAVSGALAATVYPSFEALINLLKFQQQYPAIVTNIATGDTLSFYTILTQAATTFPVDANNTPIIPGGFMTGLITNLSKLTGWNLSDLTTLATPATGTLTLSFPADFKSIPVYQRLAKRITTQQQLGIAVSDGFTWTKDQLLAADVARIKQTLKSKLATSDWIQISTTLQNTLREKRRDALIAYLLANPGSNNWQVADDLYGFFLMDVQMCSCQPTSRIIQATNSVQLFVQRCFLQLEPNIVIDSFVDADWKQWNGWMNQFRLWQANMKIFLYPENYIEPSLLPVGIKSSFFADLENDLLQNEVTADSAEAAFMSYLTKLRDVARLEIRNHYYDDFTDTFYVFARTYGGSPKQYYFRTFVENRRWTPWQKVDVDIDSDFIIPVVFNKHLYLFWAQFSEETVPGYQAAVAVANNPLPPPPPKQWLIKLAYSEYQNGQWSAKKVSQDDSSTIAVLQKDFPDMRRFYFATLDVPNLDYSLIHTTPDNANTINGYNIDVINMDYVFAKNGSLIINCFYSKTNADSNRFLDVFTGDTFINNFILDVTKGYPVPLNIPQTVNLTFNRASELGIDIEFYEASNMINMQHGELYPPLNATNITISGTAVPVPGQFRGPFAKTVAFHSNVTDRLTYLQHFVPLAPLTTVGFTTSGLLPRFYQDNLRTYFLRPQFTNTNFLYTYIDYRSDLIAELTIARNPNWSQLQATVFAAKFSEQYFNFYHPFIGYFMQQMFDGGIDALMDRSTQLKGDPDPKVDPNKNKFDFATFYSDLLPGLFTKFNKSSPQFLATVDPPVYTGTNNAALPTENVDFSMESGYGLYNWELFYHAPLLIAESLSQNQQFDEATKWYKYIFNPTDTSANPAPNKFWVTKPFFEATADDYANENIAKLLQDINSAGPAALPSNPLIQDVTDLRNNPFQPHFIAETRTVAYQKTAVMKYIGHLIRHADYLFTQDTMESVNQATQLYILASEILGPKPEAIPSIAETDVANYRQLEGLLDDLSDAMVNVENLLPLNTVKGYNGVKPTGTLPNLQTLYFCIPPNENLIGATGYWDIVADRLFKIRHCLNINGTLAPLALFSPVIDPALLVRATAAGLDIGSILNDLNAPLPFYRFSTIIAKAYDLTSEVQSLGNLLLSVLEKSDAEALSLLRNGQEVKVNNSVMLIKQQQVKDAQNNLNNLTLQKELVTIKQTYYSGLIAGGLSGWETGAMALNTSSTILDAVIIASYFTGSVAAAAPDEAVGAIAAGMTTGAYGHVEEGGTNVGNAAANMARNLGAIASGLDKVAAIVNTNGVYNRRSQEWKFQLDSANKELQQLDQQIAAAQLRIDIANQDLTNQQLLIDNANETDVALRSKFTNQDLYNRMITQVSATYFQSYQLAYSIAKQAERCYRYELGIENSSFINFGYWDSLKKGLLAGDQMLHDLKNLEVAYLQQNQRELELSKSISLSSIDPVALTKLKTTGSCWLNLPEELFDLDYPGHYMRRVKSVSLTIPCIAGPYTTVSAKLTMTNNSVRISPIAGSTYMRNTSGANSTPADDIRFRDGIGSVQSIATSRAQNDNGLFELNFRDERYLPFEYAGAISLWHLELPGNQMPQFDYDTISDVIIDLKYTARDGGTTLQQSASDSLATRINSMILSNNTTEVGLMRIFSAKNDMPNEWYRFLNPVNPTDDQVLTVALDKSRFPLFVQDKTIKIKSIELITDTSLTAINGLVVTPAPSAPATINLTGTKIYGNNLSVTLTYNNDPGTWVITYPKNTVRLTADVLNNMVVIVHYQVS